MAATATPKHTKAGCPTCGQVLPPEDQPEATVHVVQDVQDDGGPRDWDNLGIMACWHRRYTLGDVQPSENAAGWLKANAPEGSEILPLYLLDHGGITMRSGPFGDPWDSGQVGWLVATPDAIRKSFMCKRITQEIRTKVRACLEAEVKVYASALEGDVWGYVIEGGGKDDSCFGFYGDDLDGMRKHVPDELHAALEEAWRNRQ